MIYLIPLILLGASIAALAVIVFRKFPSLVLIDVESIAKEREARKKRALLAEHAGRIQASVMREIKLILRPLGAFITKAIKELYARTLEMERKYRSVAVGTVRGGLVPKSAKKMIQDAESAARRGAVEEAEHLLVEVIKADPKNVKAYEKLGRLYQKNRQYAEAEEAFAFALKLNPNDASVHANLGELAEARADHAAALKEFQAAVATKPGNPRYLDFLLAAALQSGDRDLARGVFVRLKEVNPENQKLAELEGKIKNM